MEYIFLIGAALNIFGGCKILLTTLTKLSSDKEINQPDYGLYRLFTVGTAFTFASMYIYLYFHPEYAVPFLIFGMALKYWAFLASLVSYLLFKMPKDILISFGLSNLVVALLFSLYLVIT